MVHHQSESNGLPSPELLTIIFDNHISTYPGYESPPLHLMTGAATELDVYPPSVIAGSIILTRLLTNENNGDISLGEEEATQIRRDATTIFGAYAVGDSRTITSDTAPRLTDGQLRVAKLLNEGASRRGMAAQPVTAQAMRAMEWYLARQGTKAS